MKKILIQTERYVLRTINGNNILVLVEASDNENYEWMIFLNDTAAYLWQNANYITLKDLLIKIEENYNCKINDEDMKSIQYSINNLIDKGCLVECYVK